MRSITIQHTLHLVDWFLVWATLSVVLWVL